jgi:hypothetical protein
MSSEGGEKREATRGWGDLKAFPSLPGSKEAPRRGPTIVEHRMRQKGAYARKYVSALLHSH